MSKSQENIRPEPFRRILVLLVGAGLLLITIQGLFDVYWTLHSLHPIDAVLVVFGMWGLSYMTFLWLSFFCICFLKLSGCEFVALKRVLLGKPVHKCIDSVLNSVLDSAQKEKGISTELLKTESAQKWIMGVILLGVFLAITLNDFFPTLNLFLYGLFSSVYLGYDLVLHKYSIGRNDLTGKGDYVRLLKEIRRKAKKSD